MQVVFIVPGEPRGKGRPKASRLPNGVRMYTDGKTVAYEGLVAHEARLVMDGRPPMGGAVSVEIQATLTPPKSKPKKIQAAMLSGRIRPTTKPDLDNLAKSILDGMNGIVFGDDKQVHALIVTKRYAETAAVCVLASDAAE